MIEIAAKISGFERLVGSIERELAAFPDASVPGGWRNRNVRGELVFRYLAPGDEAIVLEGHVESEVPAVCQRCLEVFDYPLATDMRLVFGREGQGREREGYEPWEIPESAVAPVDIVDECLVMSMPLAAKHAVSADCRPGEEIVDDGMTRPFASLRAQMEEEDS